MCKFVNVRDEMNLLSEVIDNRPHMLCQAVSIKLGGGASLN